MYRSRSNGFRPLTCKRCKKRYRLIEAIKLSDARGTNDLCCPHCGKKTGIIY